MNDPIERQDAIDAVLDAIYYDEYWREQVERAISALPSAQPERNTGEWVGEYIGDEYCASYLFKCSECKQYFQEKYNFCPKCGARMVNVNETY